MYAYAEPFPAFDADLFGRRFRKYLGEAERARKGTLRAGLRGKLRGIGQVLAGFSDAVEVKVLNHLTGKTAYTSPGPLYLALTTAAVGDTDTSASLTEANYTGYARVQIPSTDWATASAGSVATSAQKAFADCTAGSSTVIGWALSPISTTAGAGDVVMYGTCASVTITTTQTPATVASGALSMSLD